MSQKDVSNNTIRLKPNAKKISMIQKINSKKSMKYLLKTINK